MQRATLSRLRYACVTSGALTFVLFLVGFATFAHWIPPLAPSLEPQDVAEHYQSNGLNIRIGMIFVLLGATAYLPWTVFLSEYCHRVESSSFLLAGVQGLSGLMCQLTFFLPSLFWTTAAFRADRDPAIVQGISDMGWIIFITAWPPFALQYLCLAVAIFSDNRFRPGFPRWTGYLQILVAVSFVPASLAVFFKTGPFAWNGLFVWWIPLTLFAAWFMTMIPLSWRMVMRESETETAVGSAA